MQAEGYKWTLELLTSGLLMLAVLLWLSGRGERAFQWLGLALVRPLLKLLVARSTQRPHRWLCAICHRKAP